MGLWLSLKSIFTGGGSHPEAAKAEAVAYNGYLIHPAPQRTAGGWNTAGTITKAEDDAKEHHFVRVATHANLDDAVSFSVTKAQQIIDQQGDAMFRPDAR